MSIVKTSKETRKSSKQTKRDKVSHKAKRANEQKCLLNGNDNGMEIIDSKSAENSK